jgi:DNA ligase D-like protein (predicted 3'-phosphoesterase)
MRDSLKEYRDKRDFTQTPEPMEGILESPEESVYVIQKHDASNLHYDLRLEVNGVLKSWAVPKGPSLNPKVRRLAVETEDHPMAYSGFEGVIPKNQYGGGTVMVWDSGTYKNLKEDLTMIEALEGGKATFWLEGKKLRGGFTLIKTGKADERRWLLLKMRDEWAEGKGDITKDKPDSVKTGKSIQEIAETD